MCVESENSIYERHEVNNQFGSFQLQYCNLNTENMKYEMGNDVIMWDDMVRMYNDVDDICMWKTREQAGCDKCERWDGSSDACGMEVLADGL